MLGDTNKAAEQPRLSPLPRQRRRDFKTPTRPAVKGRLLLLQDSDDEDNGTLNGAFAQPKSAPPAPEISFQEIISNLTLEEQDALAQSEVKTNRPYSADVSTLSKDGSRWQGSRHAKDALTMSREGSDTNSFVEHRRHSMTPSMSSAMSQRHSLESPARTPLKNGSFVSLIETQGLEKDDLDMLNMLKRRQAILRELVTTELSFSQDLAIVVQEYQQNTISCPSLTVEDVRQIFDGVEPVMTFSHDLAFELQLAAAPVLFSEALQMQTLHHEDSKTTVGAVFGQHIARLSKVFARYCSTHEAAAACLQRVSKEPAIQLWLSQRHPKDRTTAWDLPSLLIKPVQRIMKYPLLLSTLLDATSRTHPDHEAISLAYKEMLATAESINNIKRRRDLVGQIAAEAREMNGTGKTFARRNTKIRIPSIMSSEEEQIKPAIAQDALSRSFQIQDSMLQSFRLDVQEWMATMKSSLEYHSGLAAGFENVLLAKEEDEEVLANHQWRQYGSAIADLRNGALVDLGHNLQVEVLEPLAAIQITFEAPKRVIERRDVKFEDHQRAQANRERGVSNSTTLSESADEYLQLNETLSQELPVFLAISKRATGSLLKKLSILQSEWYRAWHMRLGSILPADARESELLAHFRVCHSLLLPSLAELDLINGNLAEANRADKVSKIRTSEDNSSTSDASAKVNALTRPSIRNRALSVANNAATSFKQMSIVRNPSGSTTPTLLSTRNSYTNLT